jgi:hypothetical protein
MNHQIPSAADIRSLLCALGHAQMQQMAAVSGVPFTTLWKLRSGETVDPRLETVRSLLPHLMPRTQKAT